MKLMEALRVVAAMGKTPSGDFVLPRDLALRCLEPPDLPKESHECEPVNSSPLLPSST